MQVACLLVDHLPYLVEVRRAPELARRPLLIVQEEGSQRTVLDCTPGMKGLVRGMPLQQALARCKDSTLLEANHTRYQASFDEILNALEQRSPVVEAGVLGRAYVGLDGLADLYGGEARLIANLLNAVPGDLKPRIGVSSGRFSAYVAALRASPGYALKAPEPVAEFQADASVDLLPLPWKVKTRLHSFGLHTLGAAVGVGLGPLQAQFGPEGRIAWELGQGMDTSPLLPREHEEVLSASLSLPAPMASIEALTAVADNLLGHLFSRPAMRGRFARVCTLDAALFRAHPWQRRIAFRDAVGDRSRAVFVVKDNLANHPPPGPVEEMQITLSGLTGETGRQESLWSDVRRREQLRETMRQLEVRLGRKSPISQVREVEPWSRIPERRQALVPYVP